MSFIFSPPIAIGQQRQQPQRQQQQQQHQLTTEAWRPANGDFILSKSLGDTFDFGRRSVNATNSRHNRSNLTDDQDSSKIMYSGYLLKRSNHSYPASSYPDLLNTRATANSDHVINTSLLQKEQDTATGTQNNVDDSDDDNDDDDEVLNNHPRTTTANFLQPVYHAVPPPPPPDNTRVHHSANLMASFFGMTPDIQQLVINGHGYSKRETGTHATDRPVRLLPPPTIQRSPRAVPIAISPTKQPLSQQLQQPVSSQQNQPPTSQVPPPDNVIDKDGHVWRAKYCVLQHGILYFYKNEIDATSRDATLERLLMSSNSRSDGDDEPDDLSKSPLPRGGGGGWKGHYPLNGSIRDTTSTTTIKEVIWEKRVALDGVGAVRSADVEYGPCSFELSAIPDNENVTDKLVLRARNAQEMNEWLFQFHRSIASFMKTIMDAMDLAPAAPMLIRKMSSTLSTSLSHGHGRSGRHRKRISTSDATNGNTKPDITNEIVFPSSPESNGSPVQFALDRMASMPELPTEESLLPPLSLVDLETLRPDNSASISRETERALPVTPARSKTKYIPPHLRAKATETPSRYKTAPEVVVALSALDEPPSTSVPPCVLGGCADPSVAIGSIMDLAYKGRKASTVGKATTKAFGCFGGGGRDETALQWEIGAISACGIRESQEDSFLICNDLIQAFQDLPVSNGKDISMWSQSHHKPGVFAIFDGHCGNQASRYAAEKFTQYLYEQSKIQCGDIPCTPQDVVVVLEKAIQKLDDDFCRICVEEGREWESGTTALVVAVVSDHLVIANLGDCRAVMCRSVEMDCLDDKLEQLQSDGWTQDDDDDLGGKWERAIGNDTGRNLSRWCFWKEVADVHDPSREDERERIKAANGWVTTEKEIPISQLQRIDFYDEDVLEILRRCFADRLQEHQQVSASRKACNAAPQRILLISRVCGELAVSRAVGDRDFKAAFNHSISDSAGGDETSVWWECPLFLPYPDDTHSGKFKGDLVSSMPEIQTVQLSQKDVVDEFVLLACDGLWDVMDPDDAIRVTTGLLFEKKWTAKKAAARLAELAIHLGSSDNVTVIVIRFFTNT